MRNLPKKNKGITLVALVVTIIILLILAGIAISQLTGSRLFENAKLAKEKSDSAQIEEDIKLEDYNNKINEYIDGSRQSQQVTMCSPKYLCNITLPWQSRNSGTYMASSSSYNKNNDETNFSNYLSLEENVGWTVLKSGWYNFNFQFVNAYKSGDGWIEGYLNINNKSIGNVHYTFVGAGLPNEVQGENNSITLYLEKDDIIDYKHIIAPTSINHSYVCMNIFAMSK